MLFLICVPLLLPVYPPVGVGRQCLLVKKWFIPNPAVILFCSLLSNFLSSVLIRGDIWGSDVACVWVGAPVIKWKECWAYPEQPWWSTLGLSVTTGLLRFTLGRIHGWLSAARASPESQPGRSSGTWPLKSKPKDGAGAGSRARAQALLFS